MESLIKSKKQMFMESLMNICHMDSNIAQNITNFVSNNQVIRPVCNEPYFMPN